jgi:hypothetical protein
MFIRVSGFLKCTLNFLQFKFLRKIKVCECLIGKQKKPILFNYFCTFESTENSKVSGTKKLLNRESANHRMFSVLAAACSDPAFCAPNDSAEGMGYRATPAMADPYR